jgi:hypothetical protein
LGATTVLSLRIAFSSVLRGMWSFSNQKHCAFYWFQKRVPPNIPPNAAKGKPGRLLINGALIALNR